MAEANPIIVRAILSGNHSVGKSSLLRRQAQNQFSQDYVGTIGIDFKNKMYQVGQVAVKGQLLDWGFTNANSTSSGNHNIYTTTQAVGFCFAINDKKSFESLRKVIEDVRSIGSEASLFLIGCKGDLMPEVSDEEVRDYAEKHQLAYFRTSSLQNWGVNEVFSEMMKQGLPLRQVQLERQKQRKGTLVTLKPPCRQNCQFM